MIDNDTSHKLGQKLKTYLSTKWINSFIKGIVLILVFWALYHQIFQKENLEELWDTFLASQSSFRWPWLALVLVLMPLNWTFETLKWYTLVRSFTEISFNKAFQGVLLGVMVSMFTPNRIGEYGGRILVVQAEHNWRAVIATLVGSFSQLLVLLSFGIFGCTFFVSNYLSLEPFLLRSFIIIGLALVGILVFCFFNIDLLVPIAKRIPFNDKLKSYLRHLLVLKNYSSKVLGEALIFSVLRYVVYCLQYYFILQFFGIQVGLLAAFSGICTIYLIQTSVPLPPLMGLVARGEIAIFVWSLFEANEISILASTFGLFIINLSIPALLGVGVIVKINVIKSLGYENENH